MTTDTRHGTVKWFDFGKRYGFVTLDGEGQEDAMLHLSCLRELGVTELHKGTKVEVSLEVTGRGLSIKRILALEPPPELINGNGYVAATVKWFDTNKGYGFVKLEEDKDGPDVFIHAVTVKASSIIELKQDQKIMVVIEPGANGPKVSHIKAV